MANEGNTAQEVLEAGQSGELAALKALVKQLELKVAQYEGPAVIHAPFEGEPPKYRLNAKCFLENDTLYYEGDTIEYLGTPNLEMVPLNPTAKKRMDEYIAYLTELARQYAAARGREFRGLITDAGTVIAQHLADERAADKGQLPSIPYITTPEDKAEVPVMPHTKEAIAANRRRGKSRQELILNAEPAPKPKIGPEPMNIIGRRV